MRVELDSGQTAVSAYPRSVDEYFRAQSYYWEEIYQLDTLYPCIHQERVNGCGVHGGCCCPLLDAT